MICLVAALARVAIDEVAQHISVRWDSRLSPLMGAFPFRRLQAVVRFGANAVSRSFVVCRTPASGAVLSQPASMNT